MSKLAYVKIVFPSGEIWEYLADSLSRGKKDVEFLYSQRPISRYLVLSASVTQVKELITYHWAKPRITNPQVLGVCKHCGREIRRSGIHYGDYIFCNRTCLIEHYRGK